MNSKRGIRSRAPNVHDGAGSIARYRIDFARDALRPADERMLDAVVDGNTAVARLWLRLSGCPRDERMELQLLTEVCELLSTQFPDVAFGVEPIHRGRRWSVQ